MIKLEIEIQVDEPTPTELTPTQEACNSPLNLHVKTNMTSTRACTMEMLVAAEIRQYTTEVLKQFASFFGSCPGIGATVISTDNGNTLSTQPTGKEGG